MTNTKNKDEDLRGKFMALLKELETIQAEEWDRCTEGGPREQGAWKAYDECIASIEIILRVGWAKDREDAH